MSIILVKFFSKQYRKFYYNYQQCLVMVFHTTFMLALFHDKKGCSCINLFPYILWDLIVMSLVLSSEDLIKIVEGHMRSTCRKLKSQSVSLLILRHGQLAR